MAEDFRAPTPDRPAQTSPDCHHAEPCAVSNSSIELFDQEVCPGSLSDESREAAIVRAGRAVEKHHAEWERSGCFAAKGDADRARRLMELLIAGRSEAQIARMTAAQNERMAQEPGASRI